MSDGGIPPLPDNLVSFGPDVNCTLELCGIEYTVYRFRPSIPANAVFLALFAVALIIHAYQGFRWRQNWFAICIAIGCASEIVGYAGRIFMWHNPFDFTAFMVQIILITFAPVFFTASIYITLAKTIRHTSPQISRINPALYYWIFIPTDIICLILQAAGGALSTSTSGSSDTGIDLALAGLSLQVIAMTVFSALFLDHMIRFVRSSRSGALAPAPYPTSSASSATLPPATTQQQAPLISRRMKIFLSGLSLAIVLILARCAFRLYELKDGYSGDAVADEPLFIGLESTPVVAAVFALCIGHPGLIFDREAAPRRDAEQGAGGFGEKVRRGDVSPLSTH